VSNKEKRDFYRENFANLSVKIPWKEFVNILIKDFDFEMEPKSGSARVFVKEDIRFSAHEPHGKGDLIVSKWDRKRAKEALITLGLLDEKKIGG